MLSRRKGFTLIELLVVIAIIAILAAILFPVFARARQKAYQTQCLSNMKNIATAFKVYTSDYFSWWPSSTEALFYNQANDEARGQVAPYVGSDGDLVKCPGLTQLGAVDTGQEAAYAYNALFMYGCTQHDGTPAGGLTYRAYCNCIDGWGGSYKYFPTNEVWVEDPSGTILLTEVSRTTSGTWYEAGGRPWNNHTGSSYSWGDSDYRHLSGMNVAFTDGHAQWVRSGTLGLQFPVGDWYDRVADGSNLWDLGPDTDDIFERYPDIIAECYAGTMP